MANLAEGSAGTTGPAPGRECTLGPTSLEPCEYLAWSSRDRRSTPTLVADVSYRFEVDYNKWRWGETKKGVSASFCDASTSSVMRFPPVIYLLKLFEYGLSWETLFWTQMDPNLAQNGEGAFFATKDRSARLCQIWVQGAYCSESRRWQYTATTGRTTLTIAPLDSRSDAAHVDPRDDDP